MELKKGYKQTELGVIPEDWEVKNTTDIVSKNGGMKIGPFGSQLKKELLVEKGYKVYGQENVYENNFEVGKRYINEEHFQKLKTCELVSGDFIISMMGTIGKCVVVPEKIEKGIMDSHLLRLRLNEKKIYTNLLSHFFLSDLLINQVKKLSVGGIMDGLSSTIIKKIIFPLPPTIQEQIAIATALNDVDSLITNIEKLLTKKRNIKQGAMQQLLQPKEGWEVKKLGDVVEIKKGQLITDSTRINGNIPVIAGGKTPAYYHNKPNRNGKTITISGSGASAGYVSFHNYPIFASDCSTIEESKNYSIEYIYYFLLLFQEIIYKKQTGGAQPHIHPSDLSPMDFPCPSKEEQTQIATILLDMDAEITALETKLHKYQQLKQGMMQNLLTGKIRLV